MSNFKEVKTTINDQAVLVEALKKLGHTPEVNSSAKSVRGHGTETNKAEIILKKEDLKQGGDIGFAKGKDGNFTIVTDTYVMRNHGFSLPEFTKQVNKAYAEAKVMKQARIAGLRFVGRNEAKNGAVNLQFAKA